MRMRGVGVFVLAASAAAGLTPAAEGAVLRVRAGQRIQDALDRARYGDEVRVAPGDYQEELRLPGGVVLRAEEGWSQTRLLGIGSAPVVLCDGIGDRMIDGFTITGGPADGAAVRALMLQEGRLTLRDCRITDNPGDGFAAILYGGSTSLLLENSILDGNEGRGISLDIGFARARLEGNRVHDNRRGGLRLGVTEEAEVAVVGNEIADNLGEEGGGIAGEVDAGAALRLAGNRVIWNRARHGAAFDLIVSGAALEAWNNVIYGNRAFEAFGGARLTAGEGAAVVWLNNTVVHNTAPEGAALAIEADGAHAARMVNNILWGNRPVDLEGATASYSVVGSGLTEGEGNLNRAPLFLAPERGDYRLCPGSPGVDAGRNDAVLLNILTDSEGAPRIVGPAVDCGAYELAPVPLRLRRLCETIDELRSAGRVSVRVARTLSLRAVAAEFTFRRLGHTGTVWALYHLRAMARQVRDEAGRGVAPAAVPGLLGTIESITEQIERCGG